jgi:hypothetical protein
MALFTTVCGNVPDKTENLCSINVLSIIRDNDGEWVDGYLTNIDNPQRIFLLSHEQKI